VSTYKAASLAGLTQGHINSDRTTLNMKKKQLVGSSIDGVTIGVQEVADGTSEAMIK